MHRLVQELDGRLLLELETVADGIAGIDEQSDLQGQIGFGVEATQFCRRLVIVHDAEIGLLEIGDTLAMLVGDGEHDVHFVGRSLDRGDRINGIVGGLGSLVGRCRGGWVRGCVERLRPLSRRLVRGRRGRYRSRRLGRGEHGDQRQKGQPSCVAQELFPQDAHPQLLLYPASPRGDQLSRKRPVSGLWWRR